MPRTKNPDTVTKEIPVPSLDGPAGPHISKAYELKAEKDKLYAKIQANRRQCRDDVITDMTTPDQTQWVRDWYGIPGENGDVEEELEAA